MKKKTLIILMFVFVLLTSCSSGNTYYTNNIYDEIILPNDSIKVTYDLNLDLECEDIITKISDIDGYVISYGGESKVLSEYYNSDVLISSRKEYNVPIANLQQFILNFFPKDDTKTFNYNELSYEDITVTYFNLVNQIMIKQESKEYYEGLMSECSTVSDKVLLRKEIDSLNESLFQLNNEKENLDYQINFAKVTIDFELIEENDYSILYALLGMFIFGSIIAITIVIVVCRKGKRKEK